MKRSEAATALMEELIEIMEDELSTWDSKASRLLKFAEKEIGMRPPLHWAEFDISGLVIRKLAVNEWEPE